MIKNNDCEEESIAFFESLTSTPALRLPPVVLISSWTEANSYWIAVRCLHFAVTGNELIPGISEIQHLFHDILSWVIFDANKKTIKVFYRLWEDIRTSKQRQGYLLHVEVDFSILPACELMLLFPSLFPASFCNSDWKYFETDNTSNAFVQKHKAVLLQWDFWLVVLFWNTVRRKQKNKQNT